MERELSHTLLLSGRREEVAPWRRTCGPWEAEPGKGGGRGGDVEAELGRGGIGQGARPGRVAGRWLGQGGGVGAEPGRGDGQAGAAVGSGRWQVRRRRRRAGRKRRCSRRPAAAHGRGLAARAKSEWAARTSE
jgi:hypothetical protein